MKHSDFLRSLKTLKSHLAKKKEESHTFQYFSKPTQNNACICTDSHGEKKYLYNSEQELEYLLSRKDIKLYAYPCPYEKGWHLTKG